jgi:polar amino acid transport system substrate-binding protein
MTMSANFSRSWRHILPRSALALTCLLAMVANADTLQRIKDSNTFTMGFVPDYAPFSSGDIHNPEGYSIELCRKVAARIQQQLALPALQLRFVPVAIEQMLTAVQQGKVDILCSPVDETLKRRELVSFSLPVMISGLGVILERDAPAGLLGPLRGEAQDRGPLWRGNLARQFDTYTFAVLVGTNSAEIVQQRMRTLGLKSSPVLVESVGDGIKLVASGMVDAFFDDRLVLLNQQAGVWNGENLLVLDRLFQETPAALAIGRGDEDFRLLVDATLSRLFHSADGDTLYRLYFGEPSAHTRQMFMLYPQP